MNISIPSEPFEGFGKISRAAKAFGCVITEKIDGTNAQIVIRDGAIVGVGPRTFVKATYEFPEGKWAA